MSAPHLSPFATLGGYRQWRQATVYKGRNRDTAWYSVIDREWPHLATAFETWLHPSNFDTGGRQRTSLSALTRAVVAP